MHFNFCINVCFINSSIIVSLIFILLISFLIFDTQTWKFEREPRWGDGTVGAANAPSDEPECGFDNEKCRKYQCYNASMNQLRYNTDRSDWTIKMQLK